MTNQCGVVKDENDYIRQLTRCAVNIDGGHVKDVYDYIDRFGLQDATFDDVLSLIFEMGLREMKRQTDLDRYMDEHEKVRA